MLLVKTYIGMSEIHGLGVFAAEAIADGAVVWRHNPMFDLMFDERTLAQSPPTCKPTSDTTRT